MCAYIYMYCYDSVIGVTLLLSDDSATCVTRTATHCNTLQYTALHCNTLHHTATRCDTLQR